MITEMQGKGYKRLVQTPSYLAPHLLTIVAGILTPSSSTTTACQRHPETWS
jgi:hypothetical protein